MKRFREFGEIDADEVRYDLVCDAIDELNGFEKEVELPPVDDGPDPMKKEKAVEEFIEAKELKKEKPVIRRKTI